MLERFLTLKPALAAVLLNFPDLDAELCSQEWALMAKVTKALKPFAEATMLLSYEDASISIVIPVITTIMSFLETMKEDCGVIGFKKNLKRAIENNDDYILATFLDPRFKYHFFQKDSTHGYVKNMIKLKLSESLPTEECNSQTTSANESVTDKGSSFEFKKEMDKIIKKKLLMTHAQEHDEIRLVFNHYKNAPLEENPFAFWKTMELSTNVIEKNLARLAKQYLTPPPTSVDVERLQEVPVLRD